MLVASDSIHLPLKKWSLFRIWGQQLSKLMLGSDDAFPYWVPLGQDLGDEFVHFLVGIDGILWPVASREAFSSISVGKSQLLFFLGGPRELG